MQAGLVDYIGDSGFCFALTLQSATCVAAWHRFVESMRYVALELLAFLPLSSPH
jgi:hypothetical protein